MRATASPLRRTIESKVAANVVERDRDQQIVDVVSAEMRVAVGGNHFENSVVQLENRNIECAAAEIVYDDDAVLLFIEAVSERCCGRFVDQAQNIQSGDATGIFGRLPLRVIEICGYGDDGLGDGRSEKALGVALELAQHQRGNFRRRVGALTDLDAQYFALLKSSASRKGNSFNSSCMSSTPRPIRRLTE